MKYQALFSSKDKSKKLKCHLLQFLFSALRVKFSCKYTYLKLFPPKKRELKIARTFLIVECYQKILTVMKIDVNHKHKLLLGRSFAVVLRIFLPR